MEESAEKAYDVEREKTNALHQKIANVFGIRGLAFEKLKRNLSENEENAGNCRLILSDKHSVDFFLALQVGAESVQLKLDLTASFAIKRKAVVFMKLFRGPFTPANVRSLTALEINKNVLQTVQLLISEVYLPILENPANQAGWTELISRDFMERLNDFVAHIHLILGKMQGATLLPLPLERLARSPRLGERERLQLFEARVHMWTGQIKRVIETEPEQVPKRAAGSEPMQEVAFWRRKADNLNSIHAQLQQDAFQRILGHFKDSSSAFISQFNVLLRDLRHSRREANENNIYFSAMEEHLAALETADFLRLPELFPVIVHTTAMVHERSAFYHVPFRIINFLRKLCQFVITRARDFIPGDLIVSFLQNREEIDQAVDKLQLTIDVFTKFKDAYYRCKAERRWTFPVGAIFQQFDHFLERCYDILHVLVTIQQFAKLRGAKVGGTKGRALTEAVAEIFGEYNERVRVFQNASYDLTDTAAKQFEEEFAEFRAGVKDLEQRLAAVIALAFDDADTLVERFKLIESFEPLARRPIVQDELEKRQFALLELFRAELRRVREAFEAGRRLAEAQDARAPLFNNQPPVAGAVMFARSLERRVAEPFERLRQLGADVQASEEFAEVAALYRQVAEALEGYRGQRVLRWEIAIEESTERRLRKPLLTRLGDGTLEVNFDPGLDEMLREVQYFWQIGQPVPPAAAELYRNWPAFRQQINRLESILGMHNTIITSLNAVERPLILDKIARMDKALQPGLADLRWKSPHIDEFIRNAHANVEEVFKVVTKMKEDFAKIKDVLEEFNKPLIERKARSAHPDEFYSAHSAAMSQSLGKIRAQGTQLTKSMKETLETIRADRKSAPWRDYQAYLNDFVIEGISNAICASLRSLEELVAADRRREPGYHPWFELSVVLARGEVRFSPDFAETFGAEKSVRAILNLIIKEFLDTAIQIPRIDTGGVGDYLVEMKDNYQVRALLSRVFGNLDAVEAELLAYRRQFDEYAQFLTEEPERHFERFVAAAAAELTEAPGRNPLLQNMATALPRFEAFDAEIRRLKEVRQRVGGIASTHEVSWLRVKADLLKQALQQTLDRWLGVFVGFLAGQVQTFIANCRQFDAHVLAGIRSNPAQQPDNRQLLMDVMGLVAKHRIVAHEHELTFRFAREMVQLLKRHSAHEKEPKEEKEAAKRDDYLGELDDIEARFSEISQHVIVVKTNILDLQQRETEALKRRIADFSAQVDAFRRAFLQQAPFAFDPAVTSAGVMQAYRTLDHYHGELRRVRGEAEEFNRLENLFELALTHYKALAECGADLARLKQLWDLVGRVVLTYECWRRLPWKAIRVDRLSLENEGFGALLKTVPREVKALRSFPALQEHVGNMKKTLNCIERLSSEAMFDRHWNIVCTEIGHTVDHKGPGFCFEDIARTGIHRFDRLVDEVSENANKELKIGRDLDRINAVWAKLAFEFENFNQAGGELRIFKSFDVVQEILDNDTNKVLSLLSQGKSVDVFKDQLLALKAKLNQIDTIISVWAKVQKNWKRLVNIFLLSEDIRNQLQEATKLFDQKNVLFREMMLEVAQNPIIGLACTDARRAELEEILKAIEDCEKKLNIYLEQKKKAFSRFYFVSNQTLIDILSNGNNPARIATEFLGDLFDGVKQLAVRALPGGGVAADAMVSKDGEVVPFRGAFEPRDEVENWLNALEHKMRECLQEVLEEAKAAADEHFGSAEVRDAQKMDWILRFCAQISLVAVQITWTEDVHKAFEDMEGGMGSAMRDCLEGVKRRINTLIEKVRDVSLSKELRDKIITIITIDVHSRDVVESLLQKNVTDKDCFQWASQLKFYWSQECGDVLQRQAPRFPWERDARRPKALIRIIDWAKFYSYEYVGNCGRLVITPLTDRCYITLTQALSLNMGGAPAGPAGTGKTETTKDLGRACGLPVFVFNCSEQMSTHSLGQIFMGLAQTGSWGCFDEFNRISIEVLSVVSTQVKQVLDALRERREKFLFMDEEISLLDTVGFFITMNPGYAGRTELPENLKALFRSCAMVVPDLVLICENMLMSEGYAQARELAKKFVTLYELNKSLLSKQRHYDWGLRSVKSVLRQAGKLKRSKEGVSEDVLLFGALRDFNISKIVTDDKPIFTGLLGDLFSELERAPEPLVDEPLKRAVAKHAKELGYIAEEQFCLKCVQLSEILEVRHCAFIIGPPGCGKSAVWKTLAAANRERAMDTEFDCLDPKAVTADELLGTLSKTKEFKNGVLSSIIKNQCKETGRYKPAHRMKWSVLDGDIDPGWIESLNTVMDDNKMLTLVSNDRFALTPSMRLLFEVSNMRNATPATVSRGGVLFINDSDIGWKPFYEAWLESHRSAPDRYLFDQGAVSVFLKCQSYMENADLAALPRVVPSVDIMNVETTVTIIDGLLLKHAPALREKKEEELKLVYEGIFLYAGMWGFGGTFLESGEDEAHYREFARIWKNQARVKYPDAVGADGRALSIFDFYFDVRSAAWALYEPQPFEAGEDASFAKIFVPTLYTTRLWELTELHVERLKPIMYIGNAGTGKTALLKQFIGALKDDRYQKSILNFSSRTSSESLQENIMSSGLTKLGMRTWGLGSGRTLVFFVDDINMPHVDTYGTQSPIALMRQIADYGILYDRDNLEEFNKIQDLYFCACLNPKAGSFTIEPRLQRHFSGFCLPTPNELIIKQIYRTILRQHFAAFDAGFAAMAERLVDATVLLYASVVRDPDFMPSARKFHYQFNLRELSKVTEGVVLAGPAHYRGAPARVARLWAHECKRVFQDRFICAEDQQKFDALLAKALNSLCDNHIAATEAEKAAMLGEQSLFTTFVALAEGESERLYLPVDSPERLKRLLAEKLEEYNETKAQMNLVLFNNAIMHVCRISRILDRQDGHGLLVGVGGSGKQSLTRLAAFLQGYELDALPTTSAFNATDFKTFLGDVIKKAVKPPGCAKVVLATDAQLRHEEVLVFFNDLLNNGFVPGLWAREEQEALVQSLKTEARQAGLKDSPEALFGHFVDKIRRQVHLVLCFSPVGDNLRVKARRFPGLLNSTMIDWFFSWPREALVEVAQSFLQDVELPDAELAGRLAENMAETHLSIDVVNAKFLATERRYNYTTPKSYLELIAFYKRTLARKRGEVDHRIEVLQHGLRTISETQLQINGLEEELKHIMRDVEEKKAETSKLIERVNVEKAIANEEQAKANEEERKTLELAAAANEVREKAEAAFTQARPKLERAQEALGRLSETKISNMKTMKNPPGMVVLTGKVVAYLFKGEKVDLFSDKDNESGWKKALNVMNNVKRFLQDLKTFSNETAKSLDPAVKENVKRLIASGRFNVADVGVVSVDAGNLADWAHNIIEFNESFNFVKPLEEEKLKAEEQVRAKNKELDVVKERVRALNEKVRELEEKLREAEENLARVEHERAVYLRKLDAAERLVSGLASENSRWTLNVELLLQQKLTVIGDTLLAAAFVSYIGPFNAAFRYELWHDVWLEDIARRQIPLSPGVTPLDILTTSAEMAQWKNEGLPEDEMSLQNATIVNCCSRWPLMIDPQLQGTGWLKGHFAELAASAARRARPAGEGAEPADQSAEFVRLSVGGRNWLQQLRTAITFGQKVLVEGVQEEFDAVLDPLLSQSVMKKSTTYYITLGNDQIEYSPKFRVFFQCKLANPHFRPETAAQCTIINFIVTERGLEDQLLALVVNFERQELETKKQELVRQQNDFEVLLSSLEEKLLASLSAANPETILDNVQLIEDLDNMKKTASSIELQKEEARATEKRINAEREKYRVVAAEGAMLYFLIIALEIVGHMYQYSLESFIVFFFKSIEGTTTQDESRVAELVLNIRFTVYQWISRGLFERHKTIFLTMLTLRLMQKRVVLTEWSEGLLSFLLNSPRKADAANPLADWLPNAAWQAVAALGELEEFRKLPESVEKELPARFRDWFNELAPENSRLPGDWRKLDAQPLHKLCVIRALRPDRMVNALNLFIRAVLPRGADFVAMDQNFSFNEILAAAIRDATREPSMNTPIFFILSPGADPVKEVEKIGKRMRFEYNLGNFFNIALGQGQDKVADAKLEAGFKEGHWVMLQNIHLMPSWLPSLEKKLDGFGKEDGVNANFRVFFSAEPSNKIPVGILERCLKITNEPPSGIRANMKRAWNYFPREEIDDKDPKYNHILFALCFFHSVLLERRKFGAKGWNMFYPFNIGDLRDSYAVLFKTAEANTTGKIPWADLKYIFGEIMYGGHIVDDWDRRLCSAYLEYLLEPGLLNEDFELLPFVDGKRYSFKMPPPNSKHARYHEQIDADLTEETPIAYGLHPNAEISLGGAQCDYVFASLIELLPKDKAGHSEEGGGPRSNFEAYFNKVFADYALKERMFAMADIKERIPEKGPFQNVFLQECEYMNALLEEITKSMTELSQGIQGLLTISERMETLLEALNAERVPETWKRLAYPSKRSLASWLDNLSRRIDQLAAWKDDPVNIPRVTKINMLFNPQSFLTAILQYSKKGDLNKLTLATEFTKKSIEEIEGPPPKDGVYVYGMLLECARWDWTLGVIDESRPKEMFSAMPVCLCKAVPLPPPGKQERGVYACPVYRTEDRGNTYIFTASLKVSPKNPPLKWTLGGVAIVLDVEGASDELPKDAKAKKPAGK